MIDATISRDPTGGVTGRIENTSVTATLTRTVAGGVTADLTMEDL